MRTIDADELKKAITEATYNFEQIPIRVDKVQKIIDNAPTADIQSTIKRDVWELYQRYQPRLGTHVYEFGIELKELLNRYGIVGRPQGEWINHRNDYGHNIADCSLCGKAMQWHDEDEDGIPRYCWYCGADMRGEVE